VLFSHGLHGDPSDFAPLLAGWAAAGFVVVAPAYPHTSRTAAEFNIADVLNQPADASFVLTEVLRGSMGPALDPDRVAAAGHSAGAITTIGLFTSARDARLRAGIVLAGSSIGFGDGYAGPPARLLFAHGSADPLVSYAAGRAAFDNAPWPKALLTLPGSGHSDPYLATGTSAYRAVSRTTADFLRYALFGDPQARDRLRSDAAPTASLDDRL
jgi:fermentation-respiration switch protein FrsA (DUF1100 family)